MKKNILKVRSGKENNITGDASNFQVEAVLSFTWRRFLTQACHSLALCTKSLGFHQLAT